MARASTWPRRTAQSTGEVGTITIAMTAAESGFDVDLKSVAVDDPDIFGRRRSRRCPHTICAQGATATFHNSAPDTVVVPWR